MTPLQWHSNRKKFMPTLQTGQFASLSVLADLLNPLACFA